MPACQDKDACLLCQKYVENYVLWITLPCREASAGYPTTNRQSVYTLSIHGVWAPGCTGATRYDPKYVFLAKNRHMWECLLSFPLKETLAEPGSIYVQKNLF